MPESDTTSDDYVKMSWQNKKETSHRDVSTIGGIYYDAVQG